MADGVSHIDEAACMGCGVCISKCPSGAIALRLAPEKGMPFELAELMKQAVS
jgi:ferredoxin